MVIFNRCGHKKNTIRLHKRLSFCINRQFNMIQLVRCLFASLGPFTQLCQVQNVVCDGCILHRNIDKYQFFCHLHPDFFIYFFHKAKHFYSAFRQNSPACQALCMLHLLCLTLFHVIAINTFRGEPVLGSLPSKLLSGQSEHY